MGKTNADYVIDRFLILECDTVSTAAAMKRADNGDRITQSVERRNLLHLLPFFAKSVDRMHEALIECFDDAAASVLAALIGVYISSVIDTRETNAGVRKAIVNLIRCHAN